MVGLLIIACLAPLFIKGPNGEPLMTLNDWKTDVPVQIKNVVARLTSGAKKTRSAEALQPTRVFKWQDDEGQWHFSNSPPNLEIAEEIEISDVNLMETYKPPTPLEDTGQSAGSESMSVSAGILEPGKVQEMTETIKLFQQSIDQKKEALDSLSAEQY